MGIHGTKVRQHSYQNAQDTYESRSREEPVTQLVQKEVRCFQNENTSLSSAWSDGRVCVCVRLLYSHQLGGQRSPLLTTTRAFMGYLAHS